MSAAECRSGRCSHHGMRGEYTLRQTAQFGWIEPDGITWDAEQHHTKVSPAWREHLRNKYTDPVLYVSDDGTWLTYRIHLHLPGVDAVARIRWETT